MNGRDLLDAMEYISDDLIEEAAEEVQKKSKRKFRWQRWVAAAAGIAVLYVSAVTLNEWRYMNSNKSSSSNANNSSARDTSASDTTSGGMNFSPSPADNEIYLENAYEEKEQEDGIAAGEINQSAPLTSADTESSSQSSIKNETSKQGNIFIIDDFPPKYPYREPSDLLTESSYVPPRKGTYFYSQKLTEALAYYDNEETDSTVTTENAENPYNVYHVVIKLFSDREESGNVIYGEIELNGDSKALLTEEYERLSKKGYDVSLSEDYELKGFFTKSELETFDALSEYGYIFSLVSE